jgi:hypothetical protein
MKAVYVSTTNNIHGTIPALMVHAHLRCHVTDNSPYGIYYVCE